MKMNDEVPCPQCSSTNDEVVCVKCGKPMCEDCAGLNESVEWVCPEGCDA